MRSDQTYDEIVKIVLIGDSGVGKTSFMNRFCSDKFKHNIQCTVGLDYGQKVIKISERKIMIQLWDTAGQQKFKSLTPSFYRSATAIIFMFSVDSRQSFNSIALWMKQISTFANQNVPVMIVCNKADLMKKQVSERQAHSLADAYKLPLMMSSCEKNINVEQSIYELCKLIKKESVSGFKLSRKDHQGSGWCRC